MEDTALFSEVPCAETPVGHWDDMHDRLSTPPVMGDESSGDHLLGDCWKEFANHLGNTHPGGLDERLAALNRQVLDNGITYNVYADESGPQRPWSLDLFPLMISAANWEHIERGVLQRVRLLEQVMADAYGPQRFLREGLLPAALVQGHPDYLPEMQGIAPVGGKFLSIAAFDLARGPDGHWWVVSQRTQAPSGLGYLLENRLIVSRLFPAAFHAMPVQRLAATYQAFIQGIQARSPAGADAHIALLTPGPYNETYFEHAYLARYLGLSLVQGTDLTVRNRRVYLKTLHGLRPVHGLIKRVDDPWMDPLELRADSTLGVPGLLEAIRAGHVLVANTPGTGFLESSALLGFMPALSQALLGEPLTLPAAATWWCGERTVREAELAHLKRYVIKPTYSGSHGLPSFPTVLGEQLSHEDQTHWQARIARHPEAYTLQEKLPLGHAPAWFNDAPHGRVVFKPFMLRVFALADALGSWRVLPGGLARLGSRAGIASMQHGGSSADAWVMARSHQDVNTLSLLNVAPTPTVIRSQQRVVTSRSAENLFWMGRYTERCESSLRLSQLMLESLRSDEDAPSSLHQWLTRLCQRQYLFGFPEPEGRSACEQAIFDSLQWNPAQAGPQKGLCHNLRSLRQSASALRERLSTEHWNLIVRAHEALRTDKDDPATPHSPEQALHLLKETSQMLAAITGAQTDRMTRDDGWRMLSVGRHIERADFLSQAWLLGIECGSLQHDAGVQALLELFDSTITFQAQYQQSRSLAALMDVLLLSPDNPRSLAWVLKTLRSRLLKLADSLTPAHRAGDEPAPEHLLHRLAHQLPVLKESDLAQLCPDGITPALSFPELLARCSATALDVASQLSASCFAHAGQSGQSVSI